MSESNELESLKEQLTQQRARLDALEKALRAAQQDGRKNERSLIYVISLFISAANEMGLTKEAIGRLLSGCMEDVDRVMQKHEFRGIIRGIQGKKPGKSGD